jgi:hypothetical protein
MQWLNNQCNDWIINAVEWIINAIEWIINAIEWIINAYRIWKCDVMIDMNGNLSKNNWKRILGIVILL